MGKALIEGLVNGGQVDRSKIVVSSSSGTNQEVVRESDWVFVAVKPLIAKTVLSEIGSLIADKLVISMMAAVNVGAIRNYTGNKKQEVVRLMANIPIATNAGLVGLFADSLVSSRNKQDSLKLLTGLGKVVEVESEDELDVLTLVSACGPAIVSLFLSLMANYGIKHKMSAETSMEAVMQTFKGTIAYLEESDTNANDLITAVATKGGITEAILSTAKSFGLHDVFDHSMDTGLNRLAKLMTDIHKL